MKPTAVQLQRSQGVSSDTLGNLDGTTLEYEIPYSIPVVAVSGKVAEKTGPARHSGFEVGFRAANTNKRGAVVPARAAAEG